jgi:hypothetical protein
VIVYGLVDSCTRWIDEWAASREEAEAMVAQVEADAPELTGTLKGPSKKLRFAV